jgi:hypothetical protein
MFYYTKKKHALANFKQGKAHSSLSVEIGVSCAKYDEQTFIPHEWLASELISRAQQL